MRMDRMPNPKRPLIELTPRKQLAAATAILIGSYLFGALVITSDPPRRQTEFAPNFDSAPLMVVPAEKPAGPSIELQVLPQPEPETHASPRGSSI
jgi:hypothetical protein